MLSEKFDLLTDEKKRTFIFIFSGKQTFVLSNKPFTYYLEKSFIEIENVTELFKVRF